MLGAKSVAPCPESYIWLPPVLTQTTNTAITLFTSPPGYLITSNLVDKLVNQGREIFWLRIEPTDCDPGVLLLSLVSCIQSIQPGVLDSALVDMQCSPGPIRGWVQLYNQYADVFVDILSPQSVIIFEHLHFLCEYPSTLVLLANSFLNTLSKHFPCILLTHEALPAGTFSSTCKGYQSKDLKINHLVGVTLANHAGIDFPDDLVRRVIDITSGRLCALNDILYACKVLGSAYTGKIIKSTKNFNHLCKKLSKELLLAVSSDELKMLTLTIHLGYWHPEISQVVLSKRVSLSEPWKQVLDNSWERLLCSWSTPLQSTINIDFRTKCYICRKAADYLAQQGNIFESIKLYFVLKNYERTGQLLEKHGSSMMDIGQWMTLEKWMDELPEATLHNYPNLVYFKGELQAARGQLSESRKTFSKATQIFSKKDLSSRTCDSLLAEGTLAAWQGDVDRSQICILNANTLARSKGLITQLGWINWTRGCLASNKSNPEDALAYLERITDTFQDPTIYELYNQIKLLLEQQQDIHQEQERLRQAYISLSQSVYDIKQQLSSLLEAPPNLSNILRTYGWQGTPMIFKIPSDQKKTELDEIVDGSQLFKLKEWLKNLADKGPRLKRVIENIPAKNGLSVEEHLAPVNSQGLFDSTTSEPHQTDNSLSFTKEPASKPGRLVNSFVRVPQADLQPKLSAHLLGSFRISLNDQLLSDQINGRGQAIFKFLLFHHGQEQHREVLMDTFWPEGSPKAARNNLNVVLHNLRQVFRTVADDFSVIEFHNCAYRFNSDLQLWLDVDAFEQHIQAGLRYEQSEALELAINAYEIGIDLYQDDFLLDDPYEEWALAPRERLRIAYLSALGHLSQIYFTQEQCAACIALCQRILARDNCREDTHCLLMRCYSRLGQRSLALRQYRACTEALQSELGVSPEYETQKLVERIRSRNL